MTTRDYNRVSDKQQSAPHKTHLVLRRNMQPQEADEAREQWINRVKDVGGARYRVIDAFRDNLGRLIGVGELIEPGVSAEPAEPAEPTA